MRGMSVEHGSAKPVPTGPSPAGRDWEIGPKGRGPFSYRFAPAFGWYATGNASLTSGLCTCKNGTVGNYYQWAIQAEIGLYAGTPLGEKGELGGAGQAPIIQNVGCCPDPGASWTGGVDITLTLSLWYGNCIWDPTQPKGHQWTCSAGLATIPEFWVIDLQIGGYVNGTYSGNNCQQG